MSIEHMKSYVFQQAFNRPERKVPIPVDKKGSPLRISEYFGENVFNIHKAKGIPKEFKEELTDVVREGRPLTKKLAEVVANAIINWANSKGVTHFCHWFQPLTGATAEKHDSFLTFDTDEETAIEHLSASQLMQGEPDASSFPHGGTRSTFEARGYTSWDLTSPIFIMEGVNGKTLCIPSGFVSYLGDALDKKTPLLRSLSVVDKAATKFLNLIGHPEVKHVHLTVGAEQEYFLLDKGFYYSRPDLVMCGRTLLGSLSPKNQQLEDHYFGSIEDRVLSFMQELEVELYRLGIPAKTRHNEVAPGQYEIAQIFRDANISADQNQIMMILLKRIALKHNFVVLLHEKPFAGVNGSGKHLNWSLADDQGNNLLAPGENPEENYRFLACVAMILEAVNRHAEVLRAAISGHGNDFRLGANEAPPSIISVFIGEMLEQILESMISGKKISASKEHTFLHMGAHQLAQLLKDNTDRNRTSPFAFTGNKFEFRAVGSSANVGFPTCVLASAVADVLIESNDYLEKDLKDGKSVEDALRNLIIKWYKNAKQVVFNGDGYNPEWVKEAEQRGLPNLRTTADALKVFEDPKKTGFLTRLGVLSSREVEMRFKVLVERYNKVSEIEFKTLQNIVDQQVLPAVLTYKAELVQTMDRQKNLGLSSRVENEVYKRVELLAEGLFDALNNFGQAYSKASALEHHEFTHVVAYELLPLFSQISFYCGELEKVVPESLWVLPSYYDMLFIR